MQYLPLAEKLISLATILYREQLFDIFGHVSLRIPEKELYLVTPGLGTAKGTLSPEDLCLMDFQGNQVDGKGKLPIEVVMHTAIHRARDEVMAIAHLHPFYCTLLTVAGVKYVPLTMQQAPFDYDIPVLDKAELIVTPAEGEELVNALGTANALFLRGHGVMVVGESAEELLYLSIYLEEGARMLAEAIKLGKPIPLRKNESEKYAPKRHEKQRRYGLIWGLYNAKPK